MFWIRIGFSQCGSRPAFFVVNGVPDQKNEVPIVSLRIFIIKMMLSLHGNARKIRQLISNAQHAGTNC